MSDPQYPHTQQIPSPPEAQAHTNGFAIASFVLAFFMTILSIIFGHMALSQIRRTGEKGRGLALAGLWISYLGVAAGVVVAVVLGVQLVAIQNAISTAAQNYSAPTYDAPGYGAPTYGAKAPGSVPMATPRATVPQQANAAPAPSSVSSASPSRPGEGVWAGQLGPGTLADRAYCQNRGTLTWLGGSDTYRGAFCMMNGQPTLVSFARDLGGNVTLPATGSASGFSATAPDGTIYTYTKDSVMIVTSTRTFKESTTLWESGASSALAHPGDLGLSTPISYPACDGSAIVIRGTAWHAATNVAEVQSLLAANPGSSYLRTDLSCRSWTGPSAANSGGAYVYAVYTPALSAADACRQISGSSLYGRWLSNDRASGDNAVVC